MIECINDMLSLIILFLIPFSAAVLGIRRMLSKRRTRIHSEVGKYYREW